MVRVTESAIALLREVRSRYPASDQVLRIVPEEGGKGYRLVLAPPQAGDEVVEAAGERIVGIDPGVASALAQASLVSQMTAEGQQLAANTPQPYPFGPISEIIRLPT